MLNKIQIKKLIKNIHKKLVLQCSIECPDLKEARINEKYIDATSSWINSNRLGDFRHIISKYCVDVRIWLHLDPQEFIAQPHFDYEHIPNGHNGHEMDFQIEGKISDSWESFKVVKRWEKVDENEQ